MKSWRLQALLWFSRQSRVFQKSGNRWDLIWICLTMGSVFPPIHQVVIFLTLDLIIGVETLSNCQNPLNDSLAHGVK